MKRLTVVAAFMFAVLGIGAGTASAAPAPGGGMTHDGCRCIQLAGDPDMTHDGYPDMTHD